MGQFQENSSCYYWFIVELCNWQRRWPSSRELSNVNENEKQTASLDTVLNLCEIYLKYDPSGTENFKCHLQLSETITELLCNLWFCCFCAPFLQPRALPRRKVRPTSLSSASESQELWCESCPAQRAGQSVPSAASSVSCSPSSTRCSAKSQRDKHTP